MTKLIVAIAAAAALSMTAVAAEAGSRGGSKTSQNGQFSSGGLLTVSPNVSIGGILNNSAILSGNGIGILGTGIMSSTVTNTVTRNSNNGNVWTSNSGNAYQSGNHAGSYGASKSRHGRR